MFVDSCIIVQLTQKKNPTKCKSVSKCIIPYLYEAQHVSGDTPPIIRSLKLHSQPLVLHTCMDVGRVVAGCYQSPATTCPTSLHVCKTRGCECSFGLLMTGGVSPGTCWASYKYGIIHFDTASSNHTSKNPYMYAKPETASAVLGSWWWAVFRPKLVELHINME